MAIVYTHSSVLAFSKHLRKSGYFRTGTRLKMSCNETNLFVGFPAKRLCEKSPLELICILVHWQSDLQKLDMCISMSNSKE